MKPLTLHISPCPNDTFMFDALINNRIDTRSLNFEVKYLDIEELNASAIAQEADISKISCAVLPHVARHYSLLNSGAALGRGNGPLLVRPRGSVRPIKHILVPGLHTTASALISRLYPSIERQEPMLFSQIAQAVERGEADAGVLIHEGRFVYAQRNLELVADLGLLWEEQMQLPLPLGAIVMRNDIDPEVRKTFESLLRESIEYAFANPLVSRDFIKQHAQEMDDTVIDSHIALFVNEFSLDLGSEGLAAIEELVKS